MEILLIGFPEGLKRTLKIPPDFRLEWFDFSSHFPRRFYDYDVLVLNLTYDVTMFFAEKLVELVELFKGGGLVVSFTQSFHGGWFNIFLPKSRGELDAFFSRYEENPEGAIKSLKTPLTSVKAGAKTIRTTPKAGILSRVLKEMDWYEYYFSEYPENSVIIANDKVGHPIALRIPCSSGEIILLPNKFTLLQRYEKEEYWSRILSPLLEILPQLKKMPEKIALPAWITNYTSPEEGKLIEQRREIDGRLERIRLRKYLIAAKGESLEDALNLALKDIGFTVEKQPEGAYADFILKLKDEEIGAVEVASSIGQIDVKEFRQLLHFLKDCEIDKRKIKGILTANHFCEKVPKERGDAFTTDAVKAAEKHGVSLITTIDLFEVLALLDKGKILQKDIQTKILSGVGVCRLI